MPTNPLCDLCHSRFELEWDGNRWVCQTCFKKLKENVSNPVEDKDKIFLTELAKINKEKAALQTREVELWKQFISDLEAKIP